METFLDRGDQVYLTGNFPHPLVELAERVLELAQLRVVIVESILEPREYLLCHDIAAQKSAYLPVEAGVPELAAERSMGKVSAFKTNFING